MTKSPKQSGKPAASKGAAGGRPRSLGLFSDFLQIADPQFHATWSEDHLLHADLDQIIDLMCRVDVDELGEDGLLAGAQDENEIRGACDAARRSCFATFLNPLADPPPAPLPPPRNFGSQAGQRYFEVKFKQGIFAGTLSGLILGRILASRSATGAPPSEGLAKAFTMVESDLLAAGRSGARASNLKQNIWPRFRPSAHLWAAWLIWRAVGWQKEKPLRRHLFQKFLATAEWFGQQGIAAIPVRSDQPILFPHETAPIHPKAIAGASPFEFDQSNAAAWAPKNWGLPLH